jgi:ribonuclease HII
MLKSYYSKKWVEAGCDEAGRGPLAGPVYAAAVILPTNFKNKLLNDSKKLSEKQRLQLRPIIEQEALAWSVAFCSPAEIDQFNILACSFKAMHRAVAQLKQTPEFLLIDGNRFLPYSSIPHQCIIKGDGLYSSIAAASILAKTYRDEYMEKMALKYPQYQWQKNKGYPTKQHKALIAEHGLSPLHRKTFNWQLPNSLF